MPCRSDGELYKLYIVTMDVFAGFASEVMYLHHECELYTWGGKSRSWGETDGAKSRQPAGTALWL